MDKKYFLNGINCYVDPNKIFSMKPWELEISLPVESCDKKTAENFYDAKECLIIKISEISIRNFNSTILRHDLKPCQNITFLSLKPSEILSVKERQCLVGLGWKLSFS